MIRKVVKGFVEYHVGHMALDNAVYLSQRMRRASSFAAQGQ
ncbi:MAG: hypothetical protein AAF590_01570 [Pseudomonadota bacterium]